MSKNHKSHDKLHLYRVDMKYIRDLHNKVVKTDSEAEKRYKKLCEKELLWCRKYSYDIRNKANLLYKMYTSGENFSARNRCVNYSRLEEICRKYSQKC